MNLSDSEATLKQMYPFIDLEKEKQSFIENPVTWLDNKTEAANRMREDEIIRHVNTLEDIFFEFMTYLNLAEEWALEAELLKAGQPLNMLRQNESD